jgi:hypothetical protein
VPRIHEAGPLALHDAGARRARELQRMIARARIQDENLRPARQTGQGARQVALFVARENDGGD